MDYSPLFSSEGILCNFHPFWRGFRLGCGEHTAHPHPGPAPPVLIVGLGNGKGAAEVPVITCTPDMTSV